ncbi:MAG: hypothetical protein U0P45_02745 [Acidimicrobiales bacterium]
MQVPGLDKVARPPPTARPAAEAARTCSCTAPRRCATSFGFLAELHGELGDT